MYVMDVYISLLIICLLYQETYYLDYNNYNNAFANKNLVAAHT